MKKRTVYFFLFFSFHFSFAQSWDWGANGNATYTNDEGSPVATDKNGNVYITGDYIQFIAFGTHRLSCYVENSYLVKYDSLGNILWAVQPTEAVTPNSDAFAASVATDKSGNIYITGGFYGKVTFGSFILSDSSGGDFFLVKYSPSGTVIWAKQAVTLSFGIGTSLAIDKSGNIFIAGGFEGSVLFGTYLINNPNNGYDMFIAKYDSLGNPLWAKQSNINSIYGSVSVGSVATDNIGNAYVNGTYYDTISFGTDTLTSPTGYSTFLIKYSTAGNIGWVKQNEHVSINGSAVGASVVTDRANNIYITGYFTAIVKFDSEFLYSPSTNSVFLTKYDTNGHVLWAKQSSAGWEGSALKSDKYSNIYLGGVSYNNDDTFKFGNYTLTTGPLVSYASFLLKVDTSGNPVCGSMLQNLVYSGGEGITSDSSGNYVYVAGQFENDTVICGSDTLISTSSMENCFVGRWLNCSGVSGISKPTYVNSTVSIFPNPNNGNFELVVNGQLSVVSHTELVSESQIIVEVYNVLGEKVYSTTLKQVPGDSKINLYSQPNGVYFYRIMEESGNVIGAGKFIIEK